MLAVAASLCATPSAADYVVPPMAWTALSMQSKSTRRQVLEIVNGLVNRSIGPYYGPPPVIERWRVAPVIGLCHDYAVTKRWLLVQMGFAPCDLRLCVCVARPGEPHLVLIVDDLVLDNLTDVLGAMRYRVVKIQSRDFPDIWTDRL